MIPLRVTGLRASWLIVCFENNMTLDFLALNEGPNSEQYSEHFSISLFKADLVGAMRQMSSAKIKTARKSPSM